MKDLNNARLKQVELSELVKVTSEKEVQYIPRSECYAKGHWHDGIVLLIENEHNELLIQKRQVGKMFEGKWDMSVSGHCTKGDISERDTVVREVFEELRHNMTAEQKMKLQYIGVAQDTFCHMKKRYLIRQVAHVFALKIKQCELDLSVINIEEIQEVRWMEWEKFAVLLQMNATQFVPRRHVFELIKSKGIL